MRRGTNGISIGSKSYVIDKNVDSRSSGSAWLGIVINRGLVFE